jgi:hypothetical protein
METRATYYKENREKILAKNKEYYHRKKTDPEFYKNMLLRNQEYYRNGTRRQKKEWTEEEEEAYMRKIINDVKSLQDTQPKTLPSDPYLLMLYHQSLLKTA